MKNTTLTVLDLTGADVNFPTLLSTSKVSLFRVLNTIFNSFTLTSTEVSRFKLTNIFRWTRWHWRSEEHDLKLSGHNKHFAELVNND